LDRLGYKSLVLDPATDNLLAGNYDIAFNILHGQYGEDGTIQSFFDLNNIPYTGSGVVASILGMNKYLTKQVLEQQGIPTPKYVFLAGKNYAKPKHMKYPLIIKPINEGSSVCVEIIDDEKDFDEKVLKLIESYGCCLVEEFVEGLEITVGVLQKKDHVFALPILGLKPKNRFYDYEAKYTHGMTEFLMPAPLDAKTTEHAQAMAVKLHKALGCKGMSRVDAIVHASRGLFVLETNTIPGMTELSDLPAQARCAKMSFDELVDIILMSAL
jgi:D-alanine-D-alanine ligase